MNTTQPEPPIIPFQFTCPMSQLRAMALFASTDETRYVLNSVCVEITNAQTLLIATNGRALSVLRIKEAAALFEPIDADDKTRCLIPAEFIHRAHYMYRATREVQSDDAEFNPWEEVEFMEVDSEVTLTLDKKGVLRMDGPGYALEVNPIKGKFPDWRKVIPTTPRGSGLGHVNINPMYVKHFCRAAELLVKAPVATLCLRTHEGENPHEVAYTIRIPQTDFFGVLMPMKINDPKCPEQESTPDWLGIN